MAIFYINMNKEKESNIINKSIFSVGLIALFLSTYQFRDYFSRIIIQNNEKSSISLFSVIISFCFLLVVSVYLYALYYVKYSFGDRVQRWFIFKVILFFAELFYFLAMFLPLLILIMLIVDALNIPYQSILVFDIIGTVILLLFGIISAVFSLKKKFS